MLRGGQGDGAGTRRGFSHVPTSPESNSLPQTRGSRCPVPRPCPEHRRVHGCSTHSPAQATPGGSFPAEGCAAMGATGSPGHVTHPDGVAQILMAVRGAGFDSTSPRDSCGPSGGNVRVSRTIHLPGDSRGRGQSAQVYPSFQCNCTSSRQLMRGICG